MGGGAYQKVQKKGEREGEGEDSAKYNKADTLPDKKSQQFGKVKYSSTSMSTFSARIVVNSKTCEDLHDCSSLKYTQ